MDGYSQKFTLNSKGAGKTGKDVFKMTIKKKGAVIAQQAKFSTPPIQAGCFVA